MKNEMNGEPCERIAALEAEVERLQNGLAQVMRATNPGIDYDPAYAILDVQSALSRLEWLHDYIRGRRGVTNPEQAAQDERAAVVAWLTAMAERYVGVRDVAPSHVVSALAKNMAGGLHWIAKGGTP
jgi:hypothetical protein